MTKFQAKRFIVAAFIGWVSITIMAGLSMQGSLGLPDIFMTIVFFPIVTGYGFGLIRNWIAVRGGLEKVPAWKTMLCVIGLAIAFYLLDILE